MAKAAPSEIGHVTCCSSHYIGMRMRGPKGEESWESRDRGGGGIISRSDTVRTRGWPCGHLRVVGAGLRPL